ncbi:helix-turn-helix transcriptional regulator [Variovorax arabinosiphilus]|uniref:helix-turn-helix transcriptional regulator n=1 Tax=Variovorax arabinosiphilus TaxID=3053498 RepID=UPI00257650BF|nr:MULTISPECIES: AlpA family transcriptional regulator [unclassified Variovorax]MDM0120079.1 AlpA family transcriptional regulator [Variovorax sp. J2L1-78]MDM0128008.1 AlpA family transcriptional regulator [Variovorax sp. J2L1-63]MDM0231708.1 AlpA family transcriptional regulator [Variovorax sp. J2R1-6]
MICEAITPRSPITINATICGLKFFFGITLGRSELMLKMHLLRFKHPEHAAFGWAQADSSGNLWTPVTALNAAAKTERSRMRSQADNESGQRTDMQNATQRALHAAHLLQEALALLLADSTALKEHTMKRAPDRLLRLPEVESLTGLRRSAIYEQMQRGVFPRSVKAGRRAATWPESAVQSWIADRLDGRPR